MVLETDCSTGFRGRGIPTDLLDGKAGVNCVSEKCVTGRWRKCYQEYQNTYRSSMKNDLLNGLFKILIIAPGCNTTAANTLITKAHDEF